MAVQGVACDGCVVDGGAWTVSADVDSDAVTDAEADVKGPYLPAAWVASDLHSKATAKCIHCTQK